jgi:hypothetical protein
MNDPKVVIGQLAKRWLSQYGETLGTEEIRRHLSRILSELQKREIEQVFANWSGEQLLDAINATFDLDDGQGVVRVKPLEAGLCPPATAADTEYLPIEDAFPADLPVKRKGGRPPGSKNKGKK